MDYDAACNVNKGGLLVEELDGFKLPRGTCLPAVLNLLDLSFVSCFLWSLATPKQ